MPSLHLPQTQIYHRGLTNYLDGFTFLSPSLVIHNFVPNTSWTPYIHFSIWARCSRSPSQKTMLLIRKNEGSIGQQIHSRTREKENKTVTQKQVHTLTIFRWRQGATNLKTDDLKDTISIMVLKQMSSDQAEGRT